MGSKISMLFNNAGILKPWLVDLLIKNASFTTTKLVQAFGGCGKTLKYFEILHSVSFPSIAADFQSTLATTLHFEPGQNLLNRGMGTFAWEAMLHYWD